MAFGLIGLCLNDGVTALAGYLIRFRTVFADIGLTYLKRRKIELETFCSKPGKTFLKRNFLKKISVIKTKIASVLSFKASKHSSSSQVSRVD